MVNAKQDILGAIDKLQESAYFIRNTRTDTSPDHVIKLTDLTGLDSEIDGPNKPNFAQHFDSVEDVLQFVTDLYSGEMSFTEEIGPRHTLYTWKMNLSALYDPPVQDWKDLLPLHEWHLPTGNWISKDEQQYDQWFQAGANWWEWVREDGVCREMPFTNVGWVYYYHRNYNSVGFDEILWLVDGTGRRIDPKTEFPYFENYTFNGLFPEMTTREKWEELVSILE
jgi:hypothetical protein